MNPAQLIVAVMLLFGFCFAVLTSAHDRDLSSAGAALAILLDIAIRCAYVAALHVGGFW